MDNYIDEKVKEFISFQVERQFSSLSKSFLILLEDIQRNRYNINEETYSQLRKKVLDSTNMSSREVISMLNKVNVILK